MIKLYPGAVVFVMPVPEPGQVQLTSTLYSDSASLRLRAFTAIAAVGNCPVYLAPPKALTADLVEEAETVVICKFSTAAIVQDQAQFEGLLEQIKLARGKTRLFADFCDNYAAYGRATKNPFFVEYQKALGQNCIVTASTEALLKELSPDARCGIFVVEDPSESPKLVEPRAGHKRLCWFGTIMLQSLTFVFAKMVAAAKEAGAGASFTVCTNEIRRELVTRMGQDLAIPTCFVPWNLEACWKAIQDSDLVLLPQVNDDWGRVKSHNRLVESIRNGRFAIASPIPSYQELSDYCWVGEDFAAGVRWAREHPAEVEQRIKAGQQYVSERFAPERIQKHWRELLACD